MKKSLHRLAYDGFMVGRCTRAQYESVVQIMPEPSEDDYRDIPGLRELRAKKAEGPAGGTPSASPLNGARSGEERHSPEPGQAPAHGRRQHGGRDGAEAAPSTPSEDEFRDVEIPF